MILENANISINKYECGVKLSRNITGQDFYQNGGNINITETAFGFRSNTGINDSNEYKATLYFNGDTKFSNGEIGIWNCNIQVGDNNSTNNPRLLIDVDNTKKYYDRSYGINNDSDYTISFIKGKTAIYSHYDHNKTTAIRINGSWNQNIITINNGFLLGFLDLQYGLELTQYVGSETYTGFNTSTFYYCWVDDLAWYCTNKPSGTELSDRKTFNLLFDIENTVNVYLSGNAATDGWLTNDNATIMVHIWNSGSTEYTYIADTVERIDNNTKFLIKVTTHDIEKGANIQIVRAHPNTPETDGAPASEDVYNWSTDSTIGRNVEFYYADVVMN